MLRICKRYISQTRRAVMLFVQKAPAAIALSMSVERDVSVAQNDEANGSLQGRLITPQSSSPYCPTPTDPKSSPPLVDSGHGRIFRLRVASRVIPERVAFAKQGPDARATRDGMKVSY